MTKVVDRIKSVTDFLNDAVKAFKGNDLAKGLADALPWVEFVGGAVGEALLPVKFVLKLFEQGYYGNDPQKLGELACITAYQRSVEKAFLTIGLPHTAPPQKNYKSIKAQLSSIESKGSYNMENFSLDEPFTSLC